MTSTEQHNKLLSFFKWAMEGVCSGYDLDGWDVEAKAVELGLAHYEPYAPEKHSVLEYCEPGDSFLVLDVKEQRAG